eukprot:192156_1
MVSSFDFEECYPPISHSPYWTILFGFVTSTFLTYITYSSGRGLFSLFKSFMSCRCCYNKKFNLDKSNNWSKYPKIISMNSNNPWKQSEIDKYIKDKHIYGEYALEYFKDDNFTGSIPYYENQNDSCYRLMFVDQKTAPYYKGWVLIDSNKDSIKYEMAQCYE